MNSDTLEELREAVDSFAEAFETMENIVRTMDENDKRMFLNPETFGPISAFLGKGAGYEAASSGSEFNDSETLISVCEEYIDFDQDDLTNDEEE